MRARLQGVDDPKGAYQGLMFACPGCASTREGYEGLHLLPVTGAVQGRPTWSFDGDLERPTLSPSILTRFSWGGVDHVCHSFLRAGVFEFLGDCTHALAGQHVELPELPTWAARA
jgi:hypothetical protein